MHVKRLGEIRGLVLRLNTSHGRWSGSHKLDLGEMSGIPLKNNPSFILRFLSGTVYLDHAGATLFPQSQLTSFTKDLMENVYGKEKHSITDFALNVSQLHSANISVLNKMSH